MNESDSSRLRRLLVECATDTFQALNIGLHHVEAGILAEFTCSGPIAAFVGLAGASLRGSVTFVGPLSLLCAAYPLQLRGEPEAALDVLDWSGEVANQVVGSFMNRLGTAGVQVFASTPKVILTEHLSAVALARGCLCELRYRATSGQELGIWFDAESPANRHLFEKTNVKEPSIDTGDVILF